MQINSYNSTSFGVNLNSPKLRYSRNDFYVPIRGYGKNSEWADKIISTADLAVSLFRRNTAIENVLKLITKGVRDANGLVLDLFKRKNTGILRTKRDGWKSEKNEAFTSYVTGRYSGYKDRLNQTCLHPLEKTPRDVGISEPVWFMEIHHGASSKINSSLNHVFEIGKRIVPRFINEEVKEENLDEVNSNIAEIRWVLAHSTPWMRGSDAISNVLMRAMYKAIGVKTYPLKKGISLDLEAYCTELSDYKKHFPSYFENPPEIAE